MPGPRLLGRPWSGFAGLRCRRRPQHRTCLPPRIHIDSCEVCFRALVRESSAGRPKPPHGLWRGSCRLLMQARINSHSNLRTAQNGEHQPSKRRKMFSKLAVVVLTAANLAPDFTGREGRRVNIDIRGMSLEERDQCIKVCCRQTLCGER